MPKVDELIGSQRRMPRFSVTVWSKSGSNITTVLPARSGLWTVIAFAAAYCLEHPEFDCIEIGHVA
jgi:hypothetical protein